MLNLLRRLTRQAQRPCDIGATFQQHSAPDGGDWRTMDTAPRDGTPIELRNTYGIAPHYGLYRWTDECLASGQNGIERYLGEFHWGNCDGSPSFPSEGPWLHWRPYKGNPSEYIDPTGGAQKDMAYWRGASAAAYGLPPGHFEG